MTTPTSPRSRIVRRVVAGAASLATVCAISIGAQGVSAHADTVMCGTKVATIVGTSHADYLVGTTGDDVIAGLGGDDTIRGLAGNDTICGGDGDDLLNGGLGNDAVFGEAGNDEIQMSDPVVYCSSVADGFNPTLVKQAFRSQSDPGFAACDPHNGPVSGAG